MLRENASTTTTSCSENLLAKHFSKQDPLEEMMHISPFISSEPILFEITKPISKEYGLEDTLYLCEDEQSSSTSIDFELLPVGPEYVVLDHDRDTTLIFHDASLEMENPWAMEFCEVLTLESEEKDSMDEHGTVIFELQCSFNVSLESAKFSAPHTTRTTTTLRSSSTKYSEGWL